MIQPRTKYEDNVSVFVVRLFEAAGSTTYFKFDEDDLARRLFNGHHGDKKFRIKPKLRASVSIPFNKESVATFFNNSIYANRYEELFDGFNIPKSIEHDNSILVLALTLMFEEFCTKPEDKISKNVKDFYEENLLDPTTIETLNESKMIFELHNICPLCLKSELIKNKKDKLLHNFEVVRIYPKHQDLFLSTYIENTHPLIGDADDSKNKILLCKKCAKKYNSSATSKEFEKLYNTRADLDKINDDIEDISSIYDSLKELIDKTVQVKDFENLPQLELSALEVKKKIPNKTDLYEDVVRKVLKFYPTIDALLKSKEFQEIDQSTNFSKKIRERSDKYMKNGYDTGEVIYALVDDLATMASPSNPSKYNHEAFILVCYFVQHCEVLSYEVSK